MHLFTSGDAVIEDGQKRRKTNDTCLGREREACGKVGRR